MWIKDITEIQKPSHNIQGGSQLGISHVVVGWGVIFPTLGFIPISDMLSS
jgi:hypothetical protein